jgi:hypothetical protein
VSEKKLCSAPKSRANGSLTSSWLGRIGQACTRARALARGSIHVRHKSNNKNKQGTAIRSDRRNLRNVRRVGRRGRCSPQPLDILYACFEVRFWLWWRRGNQVELNCDRQGGQGSVSFSVDEPCCCCPLVVLRNESKAVGQSELERLANRACLAAAPNFIRLRGQASLEVRTRSVFPDPSWHFPSSGRSPMKPPNRSSRLTFEACCHAQSSHALDSRLCGRVSDIIIHPLHLARMQLALCSTCANRGRVERVDSTLLLQRLPSI